MYDVQCTMYEGRKIAQIGRFFCLIWLICLIRERYKFRFLCFLCEQKERGIVGVCAVVLRHAPSLNLFTFRAGSLRMYVLSRKGTIISRPAGHMPIKGFFCKKGKPSILIATSMFVSKLPHTHIA